LVAAGSKLTGNLATNEAAGSANQYAHFVSFRLIKRKVSSF
jgi:hypothetical protein